MDELNWEIKGEKEIGENLRKFQSKCRNKRIGNIKMYHQEKEEGKEISVQKSQFQNEKFFRSVWRINIIFHQNLYIHKQ